MKTTTHQCSGILFLFLLFFSLNIYTQDDSNTKKEFIRVFNFEGKKIAKGRIEFVNDSILALDRRGKTEVVKIENIGIIKTKRSIGHNVLVGSMAGGATGTLIGIASSGEETKTKNLMLIGEYTYTTGTSPGTGAVIGGGLGIAGGALIGLGTSFFKKSKTYLINGDHEKLKLFMEIISK